MLYCNHIHSYIPRRGAHVCQTWQRENYLNLPECRKCRFPRNSSWRLPWLHPLCPQYEQDPHVWSPLGKPWQSSCHFLLACQLQLNPSCRAETLRQSNLFGMDVASFLFFQNLRDNEELIVMLAIMFSEQNWNMLLFNFFNVHMPPL